MTRRKLLKSLGLGSVALSASAFWATRSHAENPYYSGPVSDHFDGKVFFNPEGTPPGKITDLLKWQFNGQRSKWPEAFDSPYHGAQPKSRITGSSVEVTHIGHATFLIQVGGKNFLTDPVWSERASPISIVGPKRINPPGVNFDDLPQIDVILLTHNHYDHMDMATLKNLVAKHDPLILTPLGNDTIIANAINNAKVQTGDWDEIIEIEDDLKIHFEPCHHWGARGMKDRRMTLWSAFTVETPNRKIYHVGDTGFHKGINFIKAVEKHQGFDVAILPIGAYEPQWFMKGQHMNPEEAVEGFKLLNAKQAIGHHWGTFQLTDEPIEEPAQKLAEALKTASIDPARFYASRPGQIWTSA